MTDLSEPGDLDAWRDPPPASDVDLILAGRRLHRRSRILDWFQIGFLVLIPVLSLVTIVIAHHADGRATSARGDTHALTGDVSSLAASVDRITRNQEDTARIEAQVAALAEAFRRIAVATTPAERQEAIDALNAIPPAPPASSSSTSTSTSTPASPTTTPTAAPAASSASSPPPPSSSTTSTSTTSTTRPLIPPVLSLPTLPPLGARSASSSKAPGLEFAGGVGLLFVLTGLTAVARHERKPMTQPMRPDTATVKAAPNPAGRILRTLYMVVIAIGVAIPAATAAFGFTAATSAKLVGLAGGITILVTALWNALEGAGVIGTVAASTVALPTTRLAGDDVDAIAQAVHAAAPATDDRSDYTFAVELTDTEVDKIADAVAKRVVAAPSPAKKAPAAKKAAPRRR